MSNIISLKIISADLKNVKKGATVQTDMSICPALRGSLTHDRRDLCRDVSVRIRC